MNQYLKISPLSFLPLLCITFILFAFIYNYLLIEDRLYYNSFANIIAFEKIDSIIQQYRIYQKIGYGIIPIVVILRTSYTALCLSIGAFITRENLSFKQCFNISIKSDIIFIFELVSKINYLAFIGVNSLEDLNIRLLSAFQLLDLQIETWSSYPFLVLNIFELCYWCILALFTSAYTKKSFWQSMFFILKTYGIGLLLWIIFVVFIMLNFS